MKGFGVPSTEALKPTPLHPKPRFSLRACREGPWAQVFFKGIEGLQAWAAGVPEQTQGCKALKLRGLGIKGVL